VLDGPVQRTKPDGTSDIHRKKDLEGKISGLSEKEF